MSHNIITDTDSYKVSHHAMAVPVEGAYSYFEAREGAANPYMLFFGLQGILRQHMEGEVVTQSKLEEADKLFQAHLPGNDFFNRAGWQHVIDDHKGRLPIRIKAVPEGRIIPVSNVLMTMESTCPQCAWLVNYLETLLSRVWYPSTVATFSHSTKQLIKRYLQETNGTDVSSDLLRTRLHDFGSRGVSSYESASIGGAAHLVNFIGTDTIVAMEYAKEYYDADPETLAFSIPASEHSVMTALGEDGEDEVLSGILDRFPSGLLSIVSDSYNIYNFVDRLVGWKFRDRILARDGVFIVRPDSTTPVHPTPAMEMVWILESLWNNFGGTVNDLGYRELNPKVAAIWGDGIDPAGIKEILQAAKEAKFAASNMAFGMGGGLLQRVNRDTMRCAYKSSAQKRDGVWHDIQKKPLDISKKSKSGRLSLIEYDGKIMTVPEPNHPRDILRVVFQDGELIDPLTFEQVRQNSALTVDREPATV